MSIEEEWKAATKAIRLGHHRTEEGEHSPPIFTTSSYVYESAAQAAARFSGDEPGNIYSRFTNPTVRTFEERLAALEGGERCVATATGMAAILSTCLGLLQAGDHLLSSRSIFGSTVILFDKYLSLFGIETSYVPLSDLDAWEQAIRPETRMLFVETPSNPLTEMVDIRALADLAHAKGCLMVVDNCFCTPILQRPLELGADVVIHSATKYIDGQGRCMGGAVVGNEQLVGEEVFGVLRTAGPSMSPFNAWVFLHGLETLALRMKAHSHNADLLAQWLAQHPKVSRVHYPGLPSHPQAALAAKQMDLPGGMLAFKVSGGKEAAWKVIDSMQMISITANLGDVKSTVTHPATTTHGRLTPEQRADAGISDGLIRISAGLEDVADIQADIERGLGSL
ncbi:MAG: O-succinylhomoserine sulfhydrylase [Gammaproteobacteria bacterium]|nr:MAG: O-succinylhomoserine sulfhydrylase [Gammaproteobacteria bacterium]RTZ74944.1 MAG: O-succinylhomoserine sulfhydrylase [Gammaproteobacteria bacterium]RTZ78037.1 MAG: O-succinylhomoserine sulfhydrylase [Gammaproteobacteria bacterium]